MIINSTSKITNTTATRKKCTLKVKRDSSSEENPHSKVLWSSRSKLDFFFNIAPIIKNNDDSVIEISSIRKKDFITMIFIQLTNNHLGSHSSLFFFKLSHKVWPRQAHKRHFKIWSFKVLLTYCLSKT